MSQRSKRASTAGASMRRRERVQRDEALKNHTAEISIHQLDLMTQPQLRNFVKRFLHPDGYYELPVARWKDWTRAKQKRYGNIHDFCARLDLKIRAALNDIEPEALESQLNCPGILRNRHLDRKPLLQDIIFFGQPEAEDYYDSILNEITAEPEDDDDEPEDSESDSESKPTGRRNQKKRDRAYHSYDSSDQDFQEPKKQKKQVVIRLRTRSQSKRDGGRSSKS